jgi:hypothetical protein
MAEGQQLITTAAATPLAREAGVVAEAVVMMSKLLKTRAAVVPVAVMAVAVAVAVAVVTMPGLNTRETAVLAAPSAWQPVVVAVPPVTVMVVTEEMPAAPVRTAPVVLRAGRVEQPAVVRIPEPAEEPAHIMQTLAVPVVGAVDCTALRI